MVTSYTKLSRNVTILLLLTVTTAVKWVVLLESVNSAGETVSEMSARLFRFPVFIATLIPHLSPQVDD
jgi:hypothetical protein